MFTPSILKLCCNTYDCLQYGTAEHCKCCVLKNLDIKLTLFSDYRRSVLIIMHANRVDSILVAAGELSYTLSKLEKQKQNPPTPEDLRLVEIIMKKVTSGNTKALEILYDHAITWLNLDLWKRIVAVHMTAPSLPHPYGKFGEAVQVLPFSDCSAT